MFSRLEPLFLRQFRQAESADTRQAIREEHKDESRRRNDEEEQTQDNQDLWTDSTVVSVESLHAFLIGFLRDQIEQDKTDTQQQTAQSRTPDRKPTDIGNRATNAYAQTAKRMEHTPLETPLPSGNRNTVESEDVRLINTLIRDLQTLAANGITELNIPIAGTFLESLQQAIEKEQ